MKRVVWFVFAMAVLLILITPIYASTVKTSVLSHKAIKGDEDPSNMPYVPTGPGLIAQSPGDTAGMTHYDYQSNGSIGNRIAVDGVGTIDMIWMRSEPSYSSNNRAIWYNCWSGAWNFPGGGTSSSRRNRDGYCQLALNDQDQAYEVFHNTASQPNDSVWFGVDAFTCTGSFSFVKVPDRLSGKGYLWPYVARSGMGDIQVTMADSQANIFAYTRSTDAGAHWTALQVIDSISALTPIVVASPVSDKVCIVYTRDYNKTLVNGHTSDLMYLQSTDGRTWDFAGGKTNLTNYRTSHDSLACLYDIEAIYDYNDVLHFEWHATKRWSPNDTISYTTWLFHYNLGTSNLALLGMTDSLWLDTGVTAPFGNYAWHFHDMSLGVQQGTNNIFTVYTDYDTSDISETGYANGDVYMQASSDNGATWSERTNLTNSPTPGCVCGECDADDWPSLAEKVDNALHIEYINDKDAGAIPQSQGCDTDNPVLYLEVANPLSIDDNNQLPKNFTLNQNYPNPFNSSTSIDFELQKDSHVKLAVYDITGGLIQILSNSQLKAGQHSIIWKADGVPSGVYYYKLSTDRGSIAKKMTLLK